MRELTVEQKDRLLQITLNRPEKRNALTCDMCTGLAQAVNEAQKREDIGAIFVCAAGQVFCAGMDLDEALLPHHNLAAAHEDLFTMGAHSVKPIVMCVNGPALGGGLGLVAQSHVAVAAQSAVFGLPEIRIGLWPFLVYRAVEAALGARRTLELSLTGRVFQASEALHAGLIQMTCPPDEVCDRANVIARDIAKASPRTVAAGMQYYLGSRGKSSVDAGELAAALRTELMASGDFEEGRAAFKAKREPRWPSMPPGFYERQ
ncbi:MAG: enoyl-CoA hydratase/isomerase family protein [Acidobacteriaceae bacterium]|nr:enoyl-CoA hydratase/isomerase family protein [Acidobacteriaceae bacterium]